jgi:hypothetical protein
MEKKMYRELFNVKEIELRSELLIGLKKDNLHHTGYASSSA